VFKLHLVKRWSSSEGFSFDYSVPTGGGSIGVPGPIVGAGLPGLLGGRWSSRLVATAAKDRLSFLRN